MNCLSCCCCMKLIQDEREGKNIFTNFVSVDGAVDMMKKVTVIDALEIIAGRKISEDNNQTSKILCHACFNKLEICIDFRLQLLRSFGSTQKHQLSQIIDSLTPRLEPAERPQFSAIKNLKISSDESSTSSPTLNNEENSSNDAVFGNERLEHNLENEIDNGVSNVPSSPHLDVVCCSPEEIPKKQPESDLESDIDVCSGEEDEILELDVVSHHQEITVISSTSDSDIEVCDYKPSEKRVKRYNSSAQEVLNQWSPYDSQRIEEIHAVSCYLGTTNYK